jgi:hypothetical protein
MSSFKAGTYLRMVWADEDKPEEKYWIAGRILMEYTVSNVCKRLVSWIQTPPFYSIGAFHRGGDCDLIGKDRPSQDTLNTYATAHIPDLKSEKSKYIYCIIL